MMPFKVLVCNLTRFGDLLQTQPLLSALVAAGHKPDLLCLDDFAPATRLLGDYDRAFVLPRKALETSFEQSWQASASQLLQFANETLAETNADCLVNLTPTIPARLLSRLLSGKHTRILGFGMDSSGFGQNSGSWASFLSMGARQRHYAPFNLSDIFRKIGEPLNKEYSGASNLRKPDAAMLQWGEDFLKSQIPAEANPRGFVCFQLGASEAKRRWPVEHFQRLGALLWENTDHIPVLLGSRSESHLAEDYAKNASHPFINAVGKTDLSQLASLLVASSLLVTNDTGTMHLAAGLGVRSLAFFLATAQPWDTGPALENCCCLEPAMDCHPCQFGLHCAHGNSCRAQIQPETAASLAIAWLGQKDWQTSLSPVALSQARIWITKKDANGFMTLIPHSGQQIQPGTNLLLALRDFWSQLLDGLEGARHVNASPRPTQVSSGAIDTLKQATQLFAILVNTGPKLKASKQAGELFLKTCRNLQNILECNPELAPVGAFWREFQLNQGSDLKFFLASLKTFQKSCAWLQKCFSPLNAGTPK